MKLPHPIPYQGSKRSLAIHILQYFPSHISRLIEPFAGSAAITIASAFYSKATNFVVNDINEPLTQLLNQIINNPSLMIKLYQDIWQGQHGGNKEAYYYEIRNKFNETKKPEYLLFLLAKCVKAAVRYNAQGDFNQSPDKRRLGRNPQVMKDDILNVSQLLKNRVSIFSEDYTNILSRVTTDDLVYMDPPYQGTGLNGGFNYAGNIEFNKFMTSLLELKVVLKKQ
ncbi:Dam family site-specific DNA-(adenine-N6)-methyltransferase [Beggiatoa leptomitoformis]|uniref:Site-specific DNA-methyltransferase (adenine-specific) n=1 Tax=Beggiatoa leptomitoformis TaxID=288004 RepID=A0A2N9YCD6_9GAMM|nr:DNA adenine methylase [Beggiatoa leptomitoformis]AUI68084.1 Dam family site-specific DNA-(adenine-N6)-methyltransferase [Beggiatoa leptomitoformis]QGX03458.1 Dam family site-specific DNA-(adenine-N6)-methyltransferase [Beggiatoa leptomitoformis]